jgi:hypothetical protein
MYDKVSCQTFVLSLSRFEIWTWEMKSSKRLSERVWLRLIFRLKFSMMKYMNYVARLSWCCENIILSFEINKRIIVVLSKTSFCFFHHQFSVCIFEYIFSLLSLNCQTKAYSKSMRNEWWSMRNLISLITFQYWIRIISEDSSSISKTMMIFCSIHISSSISMILFNWNNHSSSFLKLCCSWKNLIREFLKNLFTSFFVFSLWCSQRANS